MERFRNALLHLRIPFSVFLMPVYWFALSSGEELHVPTAVAIFIIIHLFMYPASNGYNSYFDRDEKSIGGLKKPPKVDMTLFWLSSVFDILAIGGALLVDNWFAAMVIIYLLVSKAYSHPKIRLKKFPLGSTLVIAFFQGTFTYAMVRIGMGEHFFWTETSSWPFLGVSFLFLCGSYPLTQIYQHQEDSQRGDRTLSLLLGKTGTLVFSAFAFVIASTLLIIKYWMMNEHLSVLIFLGASLPIGGYFIYWSRKVWRDLAYADFEHTMMMNGVSSVVLSAAFIAILLV